MAPPRRMVRPKTPPRRILGIRKNVHARKSILANSTQIDTLEKVRKLLEKKNEANAEVPAAENPRDSRLRVAVRVRPMSTREMSANSRNVISVAPPNMLVFDPKVEQQEFFYHNKKQIDVTAKKYKNQKFAFDFVYDELSSNVTIFQDVMQPLLTTLLAGFNCSVFAYGATGSGKTFTMLGNHNHPGLTFLTMNELYRRMEGLKEEYEVQIVISYFEVYNEQVRDLLNPTGGQLQVREVGNGIDIANLTFHRPDNVHHLLEMMQKGNTHRSQHPTDHNAESSRSHALLQVHIHMRERYSNLSTNSKTAKLVMVDLAGSEKGAATGYTGQRFREGSSINKSLLALSNCISALASGRRYCSYRDSKLTRILKDSLGGNCKTVMIANISPSDTMYDDTLNTLRYAEKAKKISCNAKENKMTVHTCLSQYTKVVEEMTSKIELLEAEVAQKDVYAEMFENMKKEKDAEIQALTRKLQSTEHELRCYIANEKVDCSPSNFPSPDRIPGLQGIIDKLNEHITAKQKVRPIIEGFITEFQLNAKRYEQLKSLAEATGDARYEKASKNLSKKLTKMIGEVDTTLQKMETTGFSPCVLSHKLSWDSEVTVRSPAVKVSSHQLYNSYVNEFKSTDLADENALLRSEMEKLLKECIHKEHLLGEAALMSNQMKNLLQYYGHCTPKLQEQFDGFVAKHSGNSSVVRFAEYDGPLSPPITATNAESESDIVEALEMNENCELEDYYEDVLKRLKTASKTVSGQINEQLEDVLTRINLRRERAADDSIHEALNVTEADRVICRIGDVTFYEADEADLSPICGLPPKPLTICESDDHDVNDVRTSHILSQEVANTTVTLAKNFEETFTRDEECVENNCPEASTSSMQTARVSSSSFRLPIINEMVNEMSSVGVDSELASSGVSEAIASGSRGRPVFVPIQLGQGEPSGSKDSRSSLPVYKVPQPSIKGTVKISPLLKPKKPPGNFPQSSIGRGVGGPSTSKSRPYQLSRGGKQNPYPPQNPNPK